MPENAILENREEKVIVFGIEFIWKLEDCYENKNLENFLSLISHECKNKSPGLRQQLYSIFEQYEQVKLFTHLHSKSVDLDRSLHIYNICWSKRCRKYQSVFLEKYSGRAMITLKHDDHDCRSGYFLFAIEGDNPFWQPRKVPN